MKNLWDDFNKRTLWKQQQIENEQHPKICSSACLCKSKSQEMHQWEDYVFANWREPQSTNKNLDETFGLKVVAVGMAILGLFKS